MNLYKWWPLITLSFSIRKSYRCMPTLTGSHSNKPMAQDQRIGNRIGIYSKHNSKPTLKYFLETRSE